ncbi:MBL fold metallo-hydrolase [Pelagibius sp.]|uniref:MBL fold metallo-hydrolase n=1 Tax=Pelagibius sp. TaxID=1931238 RepID=UPI003B50A759
MIFRQLFDPKSCSFTYLVASRRGGEAILIDPVNDLVPRYLRLLTSLDLKLVQAVDTHLHADHVTGLGALKRTTGCLTAMSSETRCKMVDIRLRDGDLLRADGLVLRAIHTPGHTRDSLCIVMTDRVFTGDTLLIGGTGRTDFQGGDAGAQYDALFGRILTMPEETLVYPGHDYRGRWVSSLGEEKALNPRLQAPTREDYVDLMGRLNLAPPKMMDVALPANLRLGLPELSVADQGRNGSGGGSLIAALAPFTGF